ncbi:fumarylacetoacetate hydrolase family protein [Bordetella sp. BOR01]|uniref:fumarylacetoacetate hydrolase family protein n=1 Tax=Bordetella sp. BOR01 TaxID=2854779 RepID=UPI001C490343|nr:fumarylacetoacetate hydrolase family protein [Bordetella sp. BOR01]MBV7484089.1 fumarylacetoacetate hydrolase family protein [Bordetella sp. BOR01]
MKLLRYGCKGSEKPGVLDSTGTIRDLSGVMPDLTACRLGPESLQALRALDPAALPAIREDVRLGKPYAGMGKFICVGLNYSDHAEESGQPVPKEPIIFAKWNSCAQGPNDPIVLPRDSRKTDWEVELGVVIGKKARYIEPSEAPGHIAGYCVVNDVSEREYQLERGGQWDRGKGCDTFGPIGPWLVSADEVPDPQSLGLWLEVNGKRYQAGSTKKMVFDVNFLVSYISRFTTLEPGDLISTGTPPGVGMGQKPCVYLRDGDVVALGIDGLGEQRQTVYAWNASLLD